MTVLLLAGTGEAKRIAWGLADSGLRVLASLAGATRTPEPLPVPTRIGGFGGEDGFRAVLAAEKVHAVLDATHPFASRISERTARVCGQLGLPYAQVVRAPWTPQAGDRWTQVDQPEAVADHLPQGATVFLATGRQSAAHFGALAGRRVLLRVVDPPRAVLPFEAGEFVIGRPPFSVASEKALFEGLGVTHLVAKNAGGTGGQAKLEAARALGLPVVLIRPPSGPQGRRFSCAEEAVAWVKGL